ncbi:MAG: hypothetical protein HY902_11725, partial [Deltaproteobacteria bacterium]|nr:hypothetical protein [Deltaproteobacteria bacterium]
MAINVKGKVGFVRIQDRTATEVPRIRAAENVRRELHGLPAREADVPTFQLYFSRDADPDTFDLLFKPTPDAKWDGPLLDVGDFVGGEGLFFRTRTGEPSLWLRSFDARPALRILTKAIRPLPEKFHGLSDKETRHRQRYVDLVVNDEAREAFRKRNLVLRGLREFFDSRGYLEVETPMMHPVLGGAAARPFITHHNALNMPLYLRIAPELYLKRLVVGGIERVYEINRNFRNEGVSLRHNPEFTMLEYYRAYANFADLMDEVEELLRFLCRKVNGSDTVRWGTNEDGSPRIIDLGKPFQRVRIRQKDGEAAAPEHALRDAPHLPARDPRPPVRRHRDQPRMESLGERDNLFRRVPDRRFAPRAQPGGTQAIADLAHPRRDLLQPRRPLLFVHATRVVWKDVQQHHLRRLPLQDAVHVDQNALGERRTIQR